MELNFKVQNLKCGGCANSITKKLSNIPEIKKIEVHPETAEVQLHVTDLNIETDVKQTLQKLGYPVEGDQNSISSKAKSIISCATGKMSN